MFNKLFMYMCIYFVFIFIYFVISAIVFISLWHYTQFTN